MFLISKHEIERIFLFLSQNLRGSIEFLVLVSKHKIEIETFVFTKIEIASRLILVVILEGGFIIIADGVHTPPTAFSPLLVLV